MSAYATPQAIPPAQKAADPTAVLGQRTGAWVIDALLFLALMGFFGPSPFSPFADSYNEDELAEDNCGYVLDVDDDAANCMDLGDRFYVTSSAESAVQTLVGLAWFVLVLGVLQGVTGVTPGKALVGVKVVDQAGDRPGIGRALLRTLLWIVDGFPWCVPIVGFVTALATRGHRRVGDMAAKTFVVGRAHTGPVVVPGIAAATPTYPAPPAWGGPPPPASGGTWPTGWVPMQPPGTATPPAPRTPEAPGTATPPAPGAPEAAGTATPPAAGTPEAPGTATPPAPGAPEAPAAPPVPGAPEAPGAGAPQPEGPWSPPDEGATAAPAEPQAAQEGPAAGVSRPPEAVPGAPEGVAPPEPATPAGPVWDAQRGTYIVWDAEQSRWLAWHEPSQTWEPL